MFSYITFGQNHIHKIDNQIYDKDTVCEIEAETSDLARKKAFEVFSTKWAFQYDKLPDLSYYKGVVRLDD